MKNNEVLLEIINTTFLKNNKTYFRNINFSISKNENWAIVGSNGSGKTLFAEAIAGKIYPTEGKVNYYFNNSAGSKQETSDFIAYLSFSENSSLFNYSKYYYQQRFNASESDGGITVRDLLGEAELNNEIIKIFEIEDLLNREFIKLSNGQTRKVRIIKALLKRPKLLILDSPYIGLDTDSKISLNAIINDLPIRGTNIILISTKADFPDCISHVLTLENFEIKNTETKEEYFARTSKHERQGTAHLGILLAKTDITPSDFQVVAEFSKVNIRYGENHVLRDIDWKILKGEKWALLGPNGAGKTTLLSLINADNPQAYSQQIVLFDKQRGTGESIWDIKKQIGYISPELHLYFRSEMQCFEVAATGFVDTLFLNRSLNELEKDFLKELFDYFNIGDLKERTFLSTSIGQQRLILFIRSIVKKPALLILDEPFQGMSEEIVLKCKRILELLSTSSTTMIFVTHDKSEIPDFIDKTFYLEKGIGRVL